MNISFPISFLHGSGLAVFVMLAIGGLGFLCGVWRYLIRKQPVPDNLGFSRRVAGVIWKRGTLNSLIAVMLFILVGTSLTVGFGVVHGSFGDHERQTLEAHAYRAQKSGDYGIFIKQSKVTGDIVINVSSQNRPVHVSPVQGQYVIRTREGRFRCVGEFNAVGGIEYAFNLPTGIAQSDVLIRSESVGSLIIGILVSIIIAAVCFLAAMSLLRIK